MKLYVQASNFVLLHSACDCILSFNVVLLMNRVALFCTLWILCLFVMPMLFICMTGYSRIGFISVLYICFYIFMGAVLNLYICLCLLWLYVLHLLRVVLMFP